MHPQSGHRLFSSSIGFLWLALIPISRPLLSAAIPLGESVSIGPPFVSCGTFLNPRTNQRVAALADGGSVTVWSGVESGIETNVTARILDKFGQHQGEVILVSELTAGAQDRPSVAGFGDGGFAVAWRDIDQGRLLLRLFNNEGIAQGEELELAAVAIPELPPVPALTTGSQGTVIVAWGSDDRTFRLHEFSQQGSTLSQATIQTSSQGSSEILEIGTDAEGNITILAVLTWPPNFPPFVGLVLYRIDQAGEVRRAFLPIEEHPWTASLAVAPSGTIVTVFEGGVGIRRALVGHTFDPSRGPIDDVAINPIEVFQIAEGEGSRPSSVIIGKNGLIVATWSDESSTNIFFSPGRESDVSGRVFRAWGRLSGPEFRVSATEGSHYEPSVALTSTGNLAFAWSFRFEPLPAPPSACNESDGLFFRLFRIRCQESEHVLCLGEDRFGVEVVSRVAPDDPLIPAAAIPLTDDTGAFWFFDPDNLELMTKVIDGRSQNDHHWFFYGALSNVGYDVTVTDFETDMVKTYSNPPGMLASVGDTEAFPAAASRAESSSAPTKKIVPVRAIPPLFVGAKLDSALHLNADRFEVTVDWTDPFNGSSGQGRAVPITDDTGTFWFFNPSNLELMVKVLDARPVNGHFWVFYGALTNVGYTVTARDLLTEQDRTYENSPFRFVSFADTAAFNDDPG